MLEDFVYYKGNNGRSPIITKEIMGDLPLCSPLSHYFLYNTNISGIGWLVGGSFIRETFLATLRFHYCHAVNTAQKNKLETVQWKKVFVVHSF